MDVPGVQIFIRKHGHSIVTCTFHSIKINACAKRIRLLLADPMAILNRIIATLEQGVADFAHTVTKNTFFSKGNFA